MSFKANEKISYFIFPFAYSLNMFMMTLVLIFTGLIGESELAADIAIVQAATLVVFMAFSTNSRNIILSNSETISLSHLLRFRLLFVIPLAIGSFYISKGFIELDSWVVIFLILRRSLEWLAELNISDKELKGDKTYAFNYSVIQIFTVIALLSSILIGNGTSIYIILFFWALSPGYQLFQFITKENTETENNNLSLRSFFPHLGSSWIIAISMYVFRLMIILLAGKSLAGLMFSAYAIGGMISSIFTYAIGPTLISNTINVKTNKIINIVFLVLFFLGGLVVLCGYWLNGFLGVDSTLYLSAIGMSLAGGGFMLMAQKKRMQILQIDKNSVFVEDVICNVVLIAAVPLLYFMFQEFALTILFLASGIITFIVFLFPSIKKKSINDSGQALPFKLLRFVTRENSQALILFLLVFPVFFQFSESIIFNSKELFFNSEGSLSRLPLPFSLIACFFGILFLTKHGSCYRSALTVFSFFTCMILSMLVTAESGGISVNKILLLIQFVLPVFGLLLGESYVEPTTKFYSLEAVFLYAIAIIIPVEVIATIIQSTGILTPYIYMFSIYQHVQYVPVIFVCLFYLAVLKFHDDKYLRFLILFLTPFLFAYVIFSYSSLALVLVSLLFFHVFLLYILKLKIKYILMISALLIICVLFTLFTLHDYIFYAWGQKYGHIFVMFQQYLDDRITFSLIEFLPVNLTDRITIWLYYWNNITQDLNSFLFGSDVVVDKKIAASAHNYFLDLMHSFGFVSLTPIFFLIFVTIRKSIKEIRKSDVTLCGLLIIVVYLIIFDNFFKVGMRQPYPGIIMFFLWGILLNRLEKAYAIEK